MTESSKLCNLDASLPDASYIGRLVKFVADETVGLATVAGAEVGILTGFVDGTPDKGTVVFASTAVQVRAGATLAAGDRITSNNEGKAVVGGNFGVVTTGAASGNLAIVTVAPLPVVAVKLSSPETSDGKPLFAPNGFPDDALVQIAGCGDNAGGSPDRGGGAAFNLSQTGAGSSSLDTQFSDWVYVVGGHILWDNGAVGGADDFTLEIVAPITAVTANGGGTGNCNKTGNVITPAPGNGAFDVVLANAIPVPAYDPATKLFTGYWDWSDPVTGKGTITASGSPGGAKWHLLNIETILSRFVSKFPLMNSGMTTILNPSSLPKKILPHWKSRATLVVAAGTINVVRAAWALHTARIKTAD